MNPKIKSAIWFALSFIASFGSYLAISLIYNWKSISLTNNISGLIMAPFTAVIYAFLCIPLFFYIKKKNIWLARGLIWGFLGIVIYLFTLGGCGMVVIK